MRAQRATSLFVILAGAFAMCFIAFWNKFPLVYFDTGTYILQGFTAEVPVDRPVWYCLFIRHASLAESLWLVIFAQGLFVSYLVFRFLSIFFSGKQLWVSHFLLTFCLVVTTGLSWNVSMLLPDIFSAIGFLSIVNLLLHPRLRIAEQVITSLLIMASFGVHLSNIPLLGFLGAVVGALWLVSRIRKRKFPIPFSRLAVAGGSMLLAFFLIPVGNLALMGKFTWSQGSHVFRMNHLIETGVLQKYLKENCPQAGYKICDYQDQLNGDFMWGENSPVYKTGGWGGTRIEYNRILRAVNSDPELLFILFRNNLENSGRQFFMYDVDSPIPFDNSSAPYIAIQKRFPGHIPQAIASRQSQRALMFEEFNLRTRWITGVSLTLLIVLLIHPRLRRALPWQLRWMVVLTLLLLLVNAWICGNLSTPLRRYQNRVAWLAVMDAVLCVVVLLRATPLWARIRVLLTPANKEPD